jgi:hypothetical protein
MVFVLNPIDLNKLNYSRKSKVFDPHVDRDLIEKYLKMGPVEHPNANFPIAINPVWNSQRLIMQKGAFTLHGAKFSLDDGNVSIAAIPILRDAKEQLREELNRIGVDYMTMYPELEHACKHLKAKNGLGPWE